ncbi:MAG: polyprenyl synthetase family protein [Verrucomicrobia bacterium]|nr:polyprenyl synthetase family protein [Verrucomicrobiota bacterium]
MTASFVPTALAAIEKTLSELIPSASTAPYSPLFDAARYAVISPAKRLRPLLLLATAASYGISLESALHPACALELIHTYSLIHDDLPCMDDDALRRGRPTLHKIYPEWHALLTGDYLLTYAFEILSNAPGLSAEQKLSLIRILSQSAGAEGMIGGQMIDLLSEGKEIDFDLLHRMHLGKTAALIRSALECGAVLAKASPADQKLLRSAGETIGIAFQLIDDVLDEEGTEEEIGKPVGSDQKNQKSTAVRLLGISKTKKRAEALAGDAKSSLMKLSCKPDLLLALFDLMTARKK